MYDHNDTSFDYINIAEANKLIHKYGVDGLVGQLCDSIDNYDKRYDTQYYAVFSAAVIDYLRENSTFNIVGNTVESRRDEVFYSAHRSYSNPDDIRIKRETMKPKTLRNYERGWRKYGCQAISRECAW